MIVNSLVYGLIGLVTAPIVTTILVLTIAHIVDPRCGTPGDSGGCEMGAVSIGVMAAIPGFVIGVGIALFRAWRQRTT